MPTMTMKTKRRRTIPADKARAAALGGFYSRITPVEANRSACSRCGEHSTMIGQGGECLRCRLERRKNDAVVGDRRVAFSRQEANETPSAL
jgi:hypothetical protein